MQTNKERPLPLTLLKISPTQLIIFCVGIEGYFNYESYKTKNYLRSAWTTHTHTTPRAEDLEERALN